MSQDNGRSVFQRNGRGFQRVYCRRNARRTLIPTRVSPSPQRASLTRRSATGPVMRPMCARPSSACAGSSSGPVRAGRPPTKSFSSRKRSPPSTRRGSRRHCVRHVSAPSQHFLQAVHVRRTPPGAAFLTLFVRWRLPRYTVRNADTQATADYRSPGSAAICCWLHNCRLLVFLEQSKTSPSSARSGAR